MQDNKKVIKTNMPLPVLRSQLKLIGCLSRAGMNAGNKGDFDAAIGNLKDALRLAEKLNKNCLIAKLFNNIGILYTQVGAWDKAMLSYDKAMHLITTSHGAKNFLYRTLQKNISHLFGVRM